MTTERQKRVRATNWALFTIAGAIGTLSRIATKDLPGDAGRSVRESIALLRRAYASIRAAEVVRIRTSGHWQNKILLPPGVKPGDACPGKDKA